MPGSMRFLGRSPWPASITAEHRLACSVRLPRMYMKLNSERPRLQSLDVGEAPPIVAANLPIMPPETFTEDLVHAPETMTLVTAQ